MNGTLIAQEFNQTNNRTLTAQKFNPFAITNHVVLLVMELK